MHKLKKKKQPLSEIQPLQEINAQVTSTQTLHMGRVKLQNEEAAETRSRTTSSSLTAHSKADTQRRVGLEKKQKLTFIKLKRWFRAGRETLLQL